MAPSSMLRSRSSSLSTWTVMRLPRPLQAGHMPSGWLNEKRCDQPVNGRPQREKRDPQVGVDLGERADGAAAASSQALLVDHDAGRDVPDRIDRRPGELRQPAAGVGAERLDELALRLGAYRVEHERRLAAAAHACEGDEPVLRRVDVDALEVVRAGASDLDGGHRASSSLTGAVAQPRQSPVSTFQRGADDARASPEAAALGRRLSGLGTAPPGRRSSDGPCVPGALPFRGATLIFGVPAATPVAQPRALWERRRIAQAAGLTPGIGRGEWGRTGG